MKKPRWRRVEAGVYNYVIGDTVLATIDESDGKWYWKFTYGDLHQWEPPCYRKSDAQNEVEKAVGDWQRDRRLWGRSDDLKEMG